LSAGRQSHSEEGKSIKKSFAERPIREAVGVVVERVMDGG